jgi:hypothetical protein
VTGVASADYVRPSSVPIQHAVATELAPGKAVSAVPNIPSLRQDPLAAQDAQSRVTLIDPATREVIFRVMDTRTHQVVRQMPDQALLRMRAYAKALQRGETQVRAQRHADLAV